MTFQTRLAVLGSTREGLLMVRETVAVETRARRATSWIFITGRRGPIPGTRFTASKWYLIPRRPSLRQALAEKYEERPLTLGALPHNIGENACRVSMNTFARFCENVYRSEERRVGKECRSRWSPY